MADESGFILAEGSAVTGEGITSFDFTNPQLQVPAPPTKETVKELEKLLSDQKTTLDAMRGGYVAGKSYNGIKPRNANDFDAIKSGLAQIIKTDLPTQIKDRKSWDKKYQIKVNLPGARDKVLYSGSEVYDIQQYHRKAGNYNDPEIKAYTDAVKVVNTLEAKFADKTSKESKLSKADQQLALAGAWRVVESTLTPKIKDLRSKNYPLGVDMWGKIIRKTDFQLASEVPGKVTTLVDSAIQEKDKETSRTEIISTDKYGRTTGQADVRDEQKSKEYRLFQERAMQIAGSKPEVARGIVNETVSAPVLAGASVSTAEATQRGRTAESARLEAMAKQYAQPVDTAAADIKPKGTPGAGQTGVAGASGTIGGGTTDTGTFKVGDWQAVLQDQFPGYSKDWLAANSAQHFGQDMINLMIEAAKPKGEFLGLTTEASVAAFKKRLKQTVYWQTTETTAKSFDQAIGVDRDRLINNKKLEIANSYGDVSFDDATLTQLATSAARLGLTGLGLQQAVYAGALKPGAGGAQTALAGRVLEGADADRIRNIGRAWNTKITDGEIQAILTGKADPATGLVLTEDALREQLQKKWKGAMPHLSSQFDAGLTLDQIGSSYRTYAAQLLEKPEDQINMFEGPYLQAFDNNAGGQLSLSQWIEKVKTDDRFGWQYTKQANQQATDVALTLARAFGKVA
jgi:hypothetical protein